MILYLILYGIAALFVLAFGVVSFFYPWCGILVNVLGLLYVIYRMYKLHVKLVEESKKHSEKLSDAGVTITDTFKAVFDNMKKLNSLINKTAVKNADFENRLHHLEQLQQKQQAAMARREAVKRAGRDEPTAPAPKNPPAPPEKE